MAGNIAPVDMLTKQKAPLVKSRAFLHTKRSPYSDGRGTNVSVFHFFFATFHALL